MSVERLRELADFFKKVFPRQKYPYAATLATLPKLLLVKNQEALKKSAEAERPAISRLVLTWILQGAPEAARRRLAVKYGSETKVPYGNLGSGTKLAPADEAYLLRTLYLQTDLSGSSVGFFSPASGQIYLLENTLSALGHEMAHAYAHRNWQAFTTIALIQGLNKAQAVHEGIPDYVADLVNTRWHASKPATARVAFPSRRYSALATDAQTVLDSLVALGRPPKRDTPDVPFEMFFGGFIKLRPKADEFAVGRKGYTWKWPL
jgi:hypothetical protein